MKSLPLLLVPIFLAGCTSSPYYDYRYAPAPLEVEVGSQGVPGSQVRALVTVLGIERPTKEHGGRAILRMRLENIGTSPGRLEEASIGLVSADLTPFGAPQIASVVPPEAAGKYIEPNESVSLDLLFPLPGAATAIDLSGLNLRFTLRFGDYTATAGATFRRLEWAYADPWYSNVSFGVGVGYSSCD